MKDLVTIKSFHSGLNVILDGECDFDTLLEALADKFQASRAFFKDSHLAICFEGRKISETEEKMLLKVISENSDIYIVCLIGKDESQEKTFLKAVRRTEQRESNDGMTIRGGLKDGQCIESDSSVIIYGDVNPGCVIKAGKDVIILGGLYGEVHITSSDENSHFVFSLDMQPSNLSIDGIMLAANLKKNKWGIRPKYTPKIAWISQGMITIDNYTKMVE